MIPSCTQANGVLMAEPSTGIFRPGSPSMQTFLDAQKRRQAAVVAVPTDPGSASSQHRLSIISNIPHPGSAPGSPSLNRLVQRSLESGRNRVVPMGQHGHYRWEAGKRLSREEIMLSNACSISCTCVGGNDCEMKL